MCAASSKVVVSVPIIASLVVHVTVVSGRQLSQHYCIIASSRTAACLLCSAISSLLGTRPVPTYQSFPSTDGHRGVCWGGVVVRVALIGNLTRRIETLSMLHVCCCLGAVDGLGFCQSPCKVDKQRVPNQRPGCLVWWQRMRFSGRLWVLPDHVILYSI
jgi:hypothetical protein